MSSCNDNTFGPVVAAGCRDSFDFTLLFQQSILSIGPSALFLILAPPRILRLLSRPQRTLTTTISPSYLARVAIPLIYLGLQITLLVAWQTSAHRSATDVSLAESCMRLADGLVICILSIAEYPRTVRPSTLLCVYFAFSAVFDAILPRLCQSAFNFSQPLLISRVVTYLQEANSDLNFGYGLIGATAIIYIGLAFSMAVYKHKTYRLITMVRGGLISLIYDKTIKLETGALKDGAGVTLIGTDCESIAQGLVNVHEIWASPIDIGLALYLLQYEAGVACVAPVVIAVLSTLCSVQIAKVTRKRQKAWVEAVQKRVTSTSSLLSNIKGAKMASLVGVMAARIESLRGIEINKAKAFLRIDAIMNVCASAPNLVSPMATLLIFAFTNGTLTSEKAFPALSIVAIMNQPLTLALSAIPTFWASLACFERIEKYLLLEERKNFRSPLSSGSGSPILLGTRLSVEPEQEKLPNNTIEVELEAMAPLRNATDRPPLVSIKHGSFGYGNDGQCVLQDVDLDLYPGTFYTLMGQIGSGKSTLFRAILGETRCLTGQVTVSVPSVAYCAQEPWLPNVSVKASILGDNGLDEGFYDQVVRACGLETDLIQLPGGHGTILGSKGTRLSGGQIKRVALARAVYSRLPLVLLDDCFSSLDSKTEALLFRRLLQKNEGLLRQLGCCVVLVTQSERHAIQADRLLVVESDGSISSREPTKDSTCLIDSADQMPVKAKSGEDTDPGSETQSAANQGRATDSDLSSPAARQTGDLSIWTFYFARIGLLNCAIYLILNALTAFFPRFAQVWVSFWVEASSQIRRENVNGIYGATYVLLSVGGLLAFYSVLLYMFQVMVPRSARRLHHEQLQTTIHASHSFLSRTDPGMILNRFSQDMTLVDIELPSYAVQSFFYVFSCLAQGILVATGIKYMAALIPAILAVVYVLQKFYLRTSRQLRYLELEAKSPLYSHMLETCSGLHTIRAFGWERRFREANTSLVNASQRPLYALYCVQRWLNLVLVLVVAAIATLLVALGTQLKGETSPSSMGVALVNVVNFAQTLANLITAWTSLETALGAIGRIKGFTTDVKHEDDPSLGFAPSSVGDPPSGPLTSSQTPGRLEISHASLAYEDSPPVLKDISLVVEPGMRVGICGRSGSGKSSLLLAILRMLRCTEGSIALDEQPIHTIPSETLRAAFIVVPQTPLTIPGSVRANLDPHSIFHNNDDAIVAVLQEFGLWDTVAKQGGLDTDADALSLSHGQTRLLAIARAVLERDASSKNKRIVLVDEVTNGLDAESSSTVMRALERAFKGYTVVAIAHQLETIMDYDCVVVLDAGRIAEWGNPAALLGYERGWFKSLWEEGGFRQRRMTSL
ncbi:hypothetical protein KVR01_009022 [Diaporthe batatas]|uniref:uncharacterized protein n=1 Tax=Diaporthe batatas TaxID=748121 RepID=UPI001D03A155|nr:uncharacterized protein KVR01_009022 [Diaporthe batatas]KAG8160758.1 hypothetical protein KVR01_009022 [Diaporthe batatas]